jgi:hypothetical protein
MRDTMTMICESQILQKQYDMNNILLNEYISISDASRKTSIPKSTISLHLKDNAKTDGREFIWKYA